MRVAARRICPESTIAPVRETTWKCICVADDLGRQERLILIESRCGRVGLLQVSLAQLPARAGDEVIDAALWLQPFVDVVMTGEDDLHAVLDQQRLDQDAEIDVRSVPSRIAVERVMEVGDLPLLTRLLHRGLRPSQLGRIHHIGVEHEESDVLPHIGVVALPAHVDRRIVDRRHLVVISQCGLKRDSRLEQRLERLCEFLLQVRRFLRSVEVVADHQHQVVGELPVEDRHLLGNVPLRTLAGAVVANDGELERLRRVRQQHRGSARSDAAAMQTPASTRADRRIQHLCGVSTVADSSDEQHDCQRISGQKCLERSEILRTRSARQD